MVAKVTLAIATTRGDSLAEPSTSDNASYVCPRTPRSSGLGDPLDLTHADDQVQWVGRRRVEFSEVKVEVAGTLRFRVDDKRTSADNLGRLICTEHRVLHEGGPNTVALCGEVDTKARKEDDWDLAPAGRLQECPWGVIVRH